MTGDLTPQSKTKNIHWRAYHVTAVGNIANYNCAVSNDRRYEQTGVCSSYLITYWYRVL